METIRYGTNFILISMIRFEMEFLNEHKSYVLANDFCTADAGHGDDVIHALNIFFFHFDTDDKPQPTHGV